MSDALSLHASVSPRLIENASSMFTGSISTVISELVQNARRAGATRVGFEVIATTNGGRMTIRDNGSGLHWEDFHKLLHLGMTGWSQPTTGTENPAGMGVFSLGGRTPTFSSRGWQTTFPDEVFQGRARAPIIPADSTVNGMEVSFSIFPDETAVGHQYLPGGHSCDINEIGEWQGTPTFPIAAKIMSECAFSGLEYSINGKMMRRMDYFANCISTFSTMGMKIGIVSTPHLPNGAPDYTRPFPARVLNFFGHAVPHNIIVSVTDTMAWTEKHPYLKHGSHIPTDEKLYVETYSFIGSFENTSHFEPKLPDRSALRESPHKEALKNAIEHEIYRLIAAKKHSATGKHHVARAREFGINLDASCDVAEIAPTDGHLIQNNQPIGRERTRIFWNPKDEKDVENFILINYENQTATDVTTSATIAAMIAKNPNLQAIFTSGNGADPNQKPFVPTIDAIAVTITFRDGTTENIENILLPPENKKSPLDLRMTASTDRIVRRITVTPAGKNLPEHLREPLDIEFLVVPDQYAFYDCIDPETVDILTVEDTKLTPASLAKKLTDMMYVESHHDEGRYAEDNGQDNWQDDLEINLIKQMLPPAAAAIIDLDRELAEIQHHMYRIERLLDDKIEQVTLTLRPRAGENRWTSPFRHVELLTSSGEKIASEPRENTD